MNATTTPQTLGQFIQAKAARVPDTVILRFVHGGCPDDAASIFAACRRALTANAVPSYLQVVPEIPKTLSEKPQQRLLRGHFDPCGPNVFTGIPLVHAIPVVLPP